MFDWINAIVDKVNANWDSIVPRIARLLGWICIAFAIVFAVITYRKFISM